MYDIIFSVSGWLIQGSNMRKEAYDLVPWSLMFLRMTSPSFCIQNKFWFRWKVSALSGQKGTMCISLPRLRLLRCLNRLHFQNTNSKKTKNFMMLTTDIKPSIGPSWAQGSVWLTAHVLCLNASHTRVKDRLETHSNGCPLLCRLAGLQPNKLKSPHSEALGPSRYTG